MEIQVGFWMLFSVNTCSACASTDCITPVEAFKLGDGGKGTREFEG